MTFVVNGYFHLLFKRNSAFAKLDTQGFFVNSFKKTCPKFSVYVHRSTNNLVSQFI